MLGEDTCIEDRNGHSSEDEVKRKKTGEKNGEPQKQSKGSKGKSAPEQDKNTLNMSETNIENDNYTFVLMEWSKGALFWGVKRDFLY